MTPTKTRAAAKAGSPRGSGPKFPSREEIIAFIAREREAAGEKTPGKIGKREIARAFGITGADRIPLKALLKQLESDGVVERRRKTLHKANVLPATVLADIFSRDRDGDLLAVPSEWDKALGPAPKIVVHLPRRASGPAPGLGDRALLRVEPLPDAKGSEPTYSGRVIKLLAKARSQVLGVYRADPRGGGRVVPVDKKTASRGELKVEPGDEGEAQDGDLVSVDMLRSGRLGLPTAKVRERLGSLATEKAVSLIAIHAHRIPYEFSQDALTEAQSARPATLAGREDWRNIPLVTIDPADAKDHDDAVHALPDPDPANPGGYILNVAIADVAAYVRPNSALDREALERGNSVYFPDRVVPMLPERISNDLCSLRPQEDRPALAVRMKIGADGHKISHSSHRIMMRSAAKLAYRQAQAAIDGHPDEVTAPLLESVLKPLWAAYECLKGARDKRAPLDLDLPERKILLKADGSVDRVFVPPRLDAHRLIEEFMILANVAAAETLESKQTPLIYRAHAEPTLEKLHALADFLATIEIKLSKGQVLTPAQFNDILARVRETPHEHLVNEVVLRTQAQAEYVAENYGHFGLNLRRYAHFTSPIRRYADLIVHRALVHALHFGGDGLPDAEDFPEIAARISASERRAMAAERETTDRLIAAHLSDKIGATFEARISGVTRAGLFVKLAETGADGFVPAALLGPEYYHFDEKARALTAKRETFRLGADVTVRLMEVAPLAGALRFEIVRESGGRTTSAPRNAKSRSIMKGKAGHASRR